MQVDPNNVPKVKDSGPIFYATGVASVSNDLTPDGYSAQEAGYLAYIATLIRHHLQNPDDQNFAELFQIVDKLKNDIGKGSSPEIEKLAKELLDKIDNPKGTLQTNMEDYDALWETTDKEESPIIQITNWLKETSFKIDANSPPEMFIGYMSIYFEAARLQNQFPDLQGVVDTVFPPYGSTGDSPIAWMLPFAAAYLKLHPVDGFTLEDFARLFDGSGEGSLFVDMAAGYPGLPDGTSPEDVMKGAMTYLQYYFNI